MCRSIAVMRPVLTRIIAQGKAEGTFTVPDPEAAAEIILHLGASSHDAVAHAIGKRFYSLPITSEKIREALA